PAAGRTSRRSGSPAARLANDVEVLVAAPGQVDQHDLLRGERACQRHRVGNRMRALERRDDALQARGLVKGRERLLVGDADVLGAMRVMAKGVIRAEARI